MAARARRRLVYDLVISLAITAALFLGGEKVAQLLQLKVGYFLLPTQTNCLQRSSTLGMEFRPQCSATWSESLLTGDKQTSFTTNKLGLRDAELEDDGAVRILAIGDSCTWGWQVEQDEAYPQVLQRLLNEAGGARRYRVINAGTPGYTSYQGLLFLRDRGLPLKPDVVVIGYGFNDSLPNGDVEKDLANQQRMFPLIKADDYLLKQSTLWGWLRTRIRGEGPRPKLPLRVPPEKFKENLASIVALARAHGAKPIVVSFAGAFDPDNSYGDAMGAVARELNVPLVVYTGPRIDAVHPSAEGYELLARSIVARMQEEGYLAAAPDTHRPPATGSDA